MSSESKGSKVLSFVSVILCVLLSLMLLCNVTIIIKGTVAPERPPSILGVTPLAVLTGSMSGDAEDHIEAGDLVLAKEVDTSTLEKGDVISFLEKNSTIVVTHRIIDIQKVDGGIAYVTKGDANNVQDSVLVTPDRVVGLYQARIPHLGEFMIFLQKPMGMFMFIGIPVLVMVILDVIRRQKLSNKEAEKSKEVEAELERLRKLVGEDVNKSE